MRAAKFFKIAAGIIRLLFVMVGCVFFVFATILYPTIFPLTVICLGIWLFFTANRENY